uniref:Serine protease CFSP3 n=1 Tax=Azumapecten farreri TaxID=106299 RepID=A0S0Q0_AZUFA|nr:serine protease CFSP3 [Azumapecten farreri]
MKIIVALCLVAFVACESVPTFVHPNAELIAQAKNMMTQKSSRIVYGDDAQISDFKWQASLRRSGSHICGAAIVSDKHAITAAHCVDGTSASSLSLRVGSSYHKNGGTIVGVQTIRVHERYNGNAPGYPNDIAILVVAGSLTSNVNAEAVDLPQNPNENYNGADCEITGWGRTELGGLPDILQVANTNVLSQSECTNYWGSNINTGHVCVRTGNNGACQGDSGGPLTCSGVLVGVTSWGYSDCRVSHPSVYTRITTFLDWINDNMSR